MSECVHRLPSRKRRRVEPHGDDTHADPAANEPTELPGTLVTPDLILELVSNGSIAPHFRDQAVFKGLCEASNSKDMWILTEVWVCED